MEGTVKVYTFASAFEKQRNESDKKEFFEKIYIQTETVQEDLLHLI